MIINARDPSHSVRGRGKAVAKSWPRVFSTSDLCAALHHKFSFAGLCFVTLQWKIEECRPYTEEWMVDDKEEAECITSIVSSASHADVAAAGTTVDITGKKIQVCSFTHSHAMQCKQRIEVS